MRTVRSVCAHNCPDTCGLVVDIDDAGEIVRVDGDPDHPITRGFICEKVRRYPAHVRSERRVLFPQKRIGAKGEGKFARISWDEALDTIATRLLGDIARHGGEAILPYSFSGTLGIVQSASMDRRFFHRLGASRLARTICSAAAESALAHTYGAALGVDPERTGDAKLFIAWGMNLRSTNIHQFALVQEARKRGARLVVVDPHRNRTAEAADLHLQLNPGTDAALALGLMHVIFRDGLADRDFLARETTGSEDLETRAREWTPERAASVCGIDAATIVTFAHEYATTHPSIVRAGYGFQRHSNGGQMVRAVACLTATVGAEARGGGFLLSQSGAFRYDTHAMERPDLQPHGDARTINMIGLGDALAHANDPPIATLFVYNANPATVNPDGKAVARGLMRDDLFTVVHDIYHTDTAAYADIVLPAPTFLETEDVYTSYWHRYLQYAQPVIEPRGESWSNVRLFSTLAKRMGFTEPCFDDDETMLAQTLLARGPFKDAGIAPDALARERRVKMREPKRTRRIQLRADSLARHGVDTVPQHVPLRESRDGSPERATRFPLALLTPSHHLFLNSNFGSDPKLLGRARPTLRISAHDAAARGIANGDTVDVWNDRGRCTLAAEVTDAVKPGTIVHLSLWWNVFSPGGANANATTAQAESDFGGGATFHTNLVEVAKTISANDAS